MAQGFLAQHGITVNQRVDAAEKIGAGQALALARKVRRVLSVRGKAVTALDLKQDRPEDDVLRAKLLGPTGNLRAPCLIAGRTMIVGYHEETYAEVLGV